jgi:hypothetical protein
MAVFVGMVVIGGIGVGMLLLPLRSAMAATLFAHL